jgi:cold shock CspA family protein
MEQQGRLTTWNQVRGFGTITPLDNGPFVFVHINEFQQRTRRPCLNDLLAYEIATDEQGKLHALDVRFLILPKRRSAKKESLPALFPLIAALLFVLGLPFLYFLIIGISPNHSPTRSFSAADKEFSDAYQAQQSGIQMGGEGVVVEILPDANEGLGYPDSSIEDPSVLGQNVDVSEDDRFETPLPELQSLTGDQNSGSRHQRFRLRLASGQTLLVMHNIDAAPRVNALKKGDRVAFHGQYEWTGEGGVIHWTHHDPARRHISGWLKFNGKTYK